VTTSGVWIGLWKPRYDKTRIPRAGVASKWVPSYIWTPVWINWFPVFPKSREVRLPECGFCPVQTWSRLVVRPMARSRDWRSHRWMMALPKLDAELEFKIWVGVNLGVASGERDLGRVSASSISREAIAATAALHCAFVGRYQENCTHL
jgi:hypothetical protein